MLEVLTKLQSHSWSCDLKWRPPWRSDPL